MYDVENKHIFYFPLTPQTNVRSTQNSSVLWQMPEVCPFNCGLPQRSRKQPLVSRETIYLALAGNPGAMSGTWADRSKKNIRFGCPHTLSAEGIAKKRLLERYNQYKIDLLAYARSKHFTLPLAGCAVYFFLPMPARWSQKKREIFHQTPHQSKPDLNNLKKAFEDSLLPKGGATDDCLIYHYAGEGKYWVDTFEGRGKEPGKGYIEVHLNMPVYNPKTKGYEIPANVNRLLFQKTEEKEKPADPPSLAIPFPDALPDSAWDGVKMKDLWLDEMPWESYQQTKAREKFNAIFNKQAYKFPVEHTPLDVPDKIDASDTEKVKKVLEAAANRKRKKKK